MSTIGLFRVTDVKGQNTWWEHHSYIDCAYELDFGYICRDTISQNYNHPHTFGTILCLGGNPIPGYGWQAGCGGWLNPGGTYNQVGCSFSGSLDADLCDMVSYTGQEAFKYIKFESLGYLVYPTVTAHDWRQYDRFQEAFGFYPNVVACCFDMNPYNCTANACGAPEIDWEFNQVRLMPAYDPRFPPCPDPY